MKLASHVVIFTLPRTRVLCTSLVSAQSFLTLMRLQKQDCAGWSRHSLPTHTLTRQGFPSPAFGGGCVQCECALLFYLCCVPKEQIHFAPRPSPLFQVIAFSASPRICWQSYPTHCIVLWREGERNIIKILLLPGAAWFSFGGLLNIFLTFFKPSLVFFSDYI